MTDTQRLKDQLTDLRLKGMLQQLDSEMTRVGERLSVSQLELQQLAAERAEQESVVCARQSEIEILDLRRAGLEQQIAAAQESLTILRQRREESAQTSSQHAARVATVILQDGGDGGTVTNLDTHLLGGREPAPRARQFRVRHRVPPLGPGEGGRVTCCRRPPAARSRWRCG